ncbi:hypothetical protein BKA08_001008 [Nocardioides marinisabuli]|uniref:Uncharacterized protein n=1 Tax=Nocardioides marinisabuli TaxID=419476 RepID=A0A7Y9JPV1_9ACTN|nr:hypothetical protein [Nocardioides marinisabuli]NYD56770.1 hypothetical protein [Nocardioides marinisabuli]
MGGADYGIGPAGAARILVEVGGVARFAGRPGPARQSLYPGREHMEDLLPGTR